jgi:hypothetical protein
VAAGALAAGASALASSDEPTAPAAAPQPKVFHTFDGARRHHDCKRGGGRHGRRDAPMNDTALRY